MAKEFYYLILLIFQIAFIPFYFMIFKYRSNLEGSNNIYSRGPQNVQAMVYVGFGFLMAVLKKYSYSAIAFNMVLAALVVQWYLIVHGIMMYYILGRGTIEFTRYLLNVTMLKSVTVLVTFGALVGRASVGQFICIAIIETIVANFNGYLLSDIFQVVDSGWSVTVHTFGAFFGIGISAAWHCRLRKPVAGKPELEGPSYHSDVLGMLGSIFLFVYWPSFNSLRVGQEWEYQDPVYLRAYSNTSFALASCLVTSFIISSFFDDGKIRMEHVQRSSLAGGVGVGSICFMIITPGGALLVGIVSGIISALGNGKVKPFLRRTCGITDTCGVLQIHGIPGVLSGLISIVLCAIATKKGLYIQQELKVIFVAIGEGRSPKMQAVYQLAGVGATVGIAFTGGLITGIITRLKIFQPVPLVDQFKDDRNWKAP